MTVNQRIENILRVSRAARNSDKELWLIYAQKSGMMLSEAQQKIFRAMPSFETIRRTRQKIQELGKYLADPAIEKQRYEKFKQVRENINYETPEELLERQGYKILPFGE